LPHSQRFIIITGYVRGSQDSQIDLYFGFVEAFTLSKFSILFDEEIGYLRII
jgi:hypothetical protein